jgi:hypothetical protein
VLYVLLDVRTAGDDRSKALGDPGIGGVGGVAGYFGFIDPNVKQWALASGEMHGDAVLHMQL